MREFHRSFAVHPDVLRVRYDIYAVAKKWELAAQIAEIICQQFPQMPFGFVQLGFALHELRRTKEALNVLLPVVDRFPDEHVIPYNLACYSCQLGDRKTAWAWLERAIDVSDSPYVKQRALDDPDLEPLWLDIAQI